MLKSRCIIAKAGAYKKGDYVLLNKEYWVVRSWMTVGDVVEYLCEATGELAKGESDAEEPMTTISLHNEIKALQALCQSTHESVEVLTELVAAASNKRSNGIWELENRSCVSCGRSSFLLFPPLVLHGSGFGSG